MTPTLEDVRDLMVRRFDHPSFRPGQATIIQHLLDGHSAIFVSPTGGGKSLCYQLPALLFEGVTLVVSPLLALMRDQIRALQHKGIAAASLDSSLSAEAYADVIERVRTGALKLLYVSPERFNNERFRALLPELHIALFAVDEAHSISEWGHNFRPDYLKIARFANACGAQRVLALTATATPPVLASMCTLFNIPTEHVVTLPLARPNLTLRAQVISDDAREDQLVSLLRARQPGPAVVYVTRQRSTTRLAKRLRDEGLPAKAYHGGLKSTRREATQAWFMDTDEAIVVATIAFGMGIDKRDLRTVVHYNLPRSLEHYSQEVGRAGRDGLPATAHLLVHVDDLDLLEWFAIRDTPTRPVIRAILDDVLSREARFKVPMAALAAMYDVREPVMRTLLTYLELEGILEGGTPHFEDYRFKALVALEDLSHGRSDADRHIIQALLESAQRGRTWYRIDIRDATATCNTSRAHVIQVLNRLSDDHRIVLKVARVLHRYRRVRRPDNLEDLVDRLQARFDAREEAALNRHDHMLAWLEEPGCWSAALSAYFGAHQAPCGQCQGCRYGALKLPPRHQARVPDNLGIQINAWRDDADGVLDDERVLSLFLAGVRCPPLVQAQLTLHEGFGVLRDLSLRAVMTWVRQHIHAGSAKDTTGG